MACRRRWWVRALLAGVVALLGSGAGAPPARADEPPIARTPEFTKGVEAAIAKGVAWLRRQQLPDGRFTDYIRDIENTGAAYHALHVCKVPRDDPARARAYAWLRRRYEEDRADNRRLGMQFGTEEMGLLCLAVSDHGDQLPAADASSEAAVRLDAEDLAWMRELVKLLEKTQKPTGTWPMFVDVQEPGEFDVDCTFSALLGLKAASRAGVKVQLATWQRSLKFFVSQQDSKGVTLPAAPGSGGRSVKARGWDLSTRKGRSGYEASDWDTANALTSLAICRSEILAAQKGRPPVGDAATLAAFRDGLAYLGHDTFILESLQTAADDVNELYFSDAYAIERAGDLLGIERMGDLDWYGAGVRALVSNQDASGCWKTSRRLAVRVDPRMFQSEDVVATSYALLFLARGTPRARWTVTVGGDDSDIRFDAAASLAEKDFEDFLDLVLARWLRATDTAVKDRLLAKATGVGPRIVAPLLRRLASGKDDERASAFALLRRATGLDHGYDPAAAEGARAEAAGRWQAWWKEHEGTLHLDAEKGLLVP